MKQCPKCGKRLPDYATKCKYCDTLLPAVKDRSDGDSLRLKTFDCPSCGAPMDYNGEESTIQCPYCRNTVIVPTELREQDQPVVGPIMEPLPLSVRVDQLLEAELPSRVITLLRRELSLQLEEAEDLLDKIQSGQYGDTDSLIRKAARGW